MMSSGSELSASDVALLSGANNRGNEDGWGGGSWIWAFLIFALFGFGDFGNGGFGRNGRGSGSGSSAAGLVPYEAGVTQADLQRGFDNQSVMNKLNGLENGLCDGFYAINNSLQSGFNANQVSMLQGFNAANVANLQGFNGVQQAINADTVANMQNTYAVQQAINADTVANMQNMNALSTQLSNCCCENREGQAQIRYDMATQTAALQNTANNNTRDILENQNSNTRAILDYLCQDKISTLTAENQSLKFQASQTAQNSYLSALADAQTAEILRRTAPLPVPAYPASNLYGYYGNSCGNCGL